MSLSRFVFMASALLSLSAFAQAKAAPKAEEKKAAEKKDELSPQFATTVDTLVKYGHAKKDALSLLTAARLMIDNGIGVAPSGKANEKPFSAEALLDEAAGYTKDAGLTALIKADRARAGNAKWVCYWAWFCDGWGNCWYKYVCY